MECRLLFFIRVWVPLNASCLCSCNLPSILPRNMKIRWHKCFNERMSSHLHYCYKATNLSFDVSLSVPSRQCTYYLTFAEYQQIGNEIWRYVKLGSLKKLVSEFKNKYELCGGYRNAEYHICTIFHPLLSWKHTPQWAYDSNKISIFYLNMYFLTTKVKWSEWKIQKTVKKSLIISPKFICLTL